MRQETSSQSTAAPAAALDALELSIAALEPDTLYRSQVQKVIISAADLIPTQHWPLLVARTRAIEDSGPRSRALDSLLSEDDCIRCMVLTLAAFGRGPVKPVLQGAEAMVYAAYGRACIEGPRGIARRATRSRARTSSHHCVRYMTGWGGRCTTLIVNDVIAKVRHPDGLGQGDAAAHVRRRQGVANPVGRRESVRRGCAAVVSALRIWAAEPALVRITASHGDVITEWAREVLERVAVQRP